MKEDKIIHFHKARNFGDIINDTFSFTRQNFKILFKSLLYIVGPFVLLLAIISGLYSADILTISIGKQGNLYNLNYIFNVKYLLIIIFSLVVFTFLTVITYEYILLYIVGNEKEFDFDDLWKETKKDFWMIFFTIIGNFFLLFLTFILLIIPGIYFMVVASIVPIIRIRERLGYFKSIGRSMKLLAGNWWLTFGLIFIFGIIISAMGGILGIPQVVATFLTVLHIGKESKLYYQLIFIATNIISQLGYFLYILPLIGMGFQYFNLIEKKEGTGLLEKIEKIE